MTVSIHIHHVLKSSEFFPAKFDESVILILEFLAACAIWVLDLLVLDLDRNRDLVLDRLG
jgi:hypothetical protein